MSRTERIDLRVSEEDKKALQSIAELKGTTVSNFVLSSALKAANEELCDRTLFKLTTTQWTDFQEKLNAPVSPKPRLKRLLGEAGVFD